jgi:threonine/homoserine/homoserine lactone efflux protein
VISWKVALFAAEAAALLGSPGPGIAALVSVGRRSGVRRSLRFFTAMQIGLALAVVVSAAGLMAAVLSSPVLMAVVAVVGTAYLLFLAVQIAAAPVGAARDAGGKEPGAFGGFLLGVANPKAYLAFIALMASNAILPSRAGDLTLKAALCVVVMIVVDLAWLWFGARTHALGLGARAERTLNLAMGATIIVAALLSLGSLGESVLAPLFDGVPG